MIEISILYTKNEEKIFYFYGKGNVKIIKDAISKFMDFFNNNDKVSIKIKFDNDVQKEICYNEADKLYNEYPFSKPTNYDEKEFHKLKLGWVQQLILTKFTTKTKEEILNEIIDKIK